MHLNRRSFLQTTFALSVGAGVQACLPGQAQAAASSRASVVEFGADATGEQDVTEAVRKAIASLPRRDARLVFPFGRYRFAASHETAMQFAGFEGIEVYANNAELLFAGETMPFRFEDSKDAALHDMKLDWDGPALEQGQQDSTRACFTFDGCQGVLLDEVALRHAPATAFLMRGCRDVTIDGATIVSSSVKNTPHGTALKRAAMGDGLHCSDCHGTIALKEVQFDGVGGDAVNIYQSYWTILDRIDDYTIVIAGANGRALHPYELPRPGDFVQFSSPTTLALLGEIGVASVKPAATGGRGSTLTFPETLSPIIVPGMLVCGVVDAPRITIDHSTFANIRNRGLVLHTRAEVTNNHFRNCEQEAILLASDASALQGPSVQNVRIRGNTFEGCNSTGPAAGAGQRGTITIDACVAGGQDASSQPINSAVRIQGNTFLQSSGIAIYAASTDGLTITENMLGHVPVSRNAPPPIAVLLHNVANAAVSNNIANLPQTIAPIHCAGTLEAQDNRQLSVAKQG